jgi:hypothetical protein
MTSKGRRIGFGGDGLRRHHLLIAVVAIMVVVPNLLSRAALGVVVHDQAQLVVYAQTWSWIYDEQMPVYQWIATAALRATGFGILTLDLLKFAGVAATCIAVFLLTKKMTRSSRAAFIGMAAIFLLPTMNEDMLREYTHSSALLAFGTLSFLFMTPFADSGPMPVRRGALWGAGILAKHTMTLLALAQVAAHRLAFGRWPDGLARSILVASALAVPVYIIMALNADTVAVGAAEFVGDRPWQRFRGLIDLFTSVVAEAGLLIALGGLALLIWRRPAAPPTPCEREARRFFLAVIGVTLGLFLVIVMVANLAVVRDRWLAPALILLAPIFAAALHRRVSDRTERIIAVALAVGLSVLGIARALEPVANRSSGKIDRENLPLREVASLVAQRAATERVDIVLADDQEIAATTKVVAPELGVYSGWTQRNVPEGARTAIHVSSDLEAKRPLSLAGWACGTPHDIHLTYRFVTEGTFRAVLRTCRRSQPQQ